MVEADSIEFNWGKKRRVGGQKKDVQFYESFTYDGDEYTLYDSVYLYNVNETEPYIGKLIKIWETPDKAKRVKILWFFRPREISHYLGTDKTLENELFLASGYGKGLADVNPLVQTEPLHTLYPSHGLKSRSLVDLFKHPAHFLSAWISV